MSIGGTNKTPYGGDDLIKRLQYLGRVAKDYDQDHMTSADYEMIPAVTKQAADRIEELERERDEQEAKIDALTSGDWSKARLVRFENGQFDFSGGPVAFIAEYLAQCMEAAGGYHNNMEVRVDHPKAGPMFVTLQRIHGKTPAQQRNEAEAKLAKAVAALQEQSCNCASNCDWEHDDVCPSWTARTTLAELEVK